MLPKIVLCGCVAMRNEFGADGTLLAAENTTIPLFLPWAVTLDRLP
jgi:hypothetical protein